MPVASLALSGCATEPVTTTADPDGTYRTAYSRGVTSPSGTDKYIDDATQPYWVWVPNGSSIGTIPPPPALQAAPTRTAIVIQPTVPPRTVVAGSGVRALRRRQRDTLSVGVDSVGGDGASAAANAAALAEPHVSRGGRK